MKKITKRTVYETLIKIAQGEDFTQYITAEELMAFATHEIELLDNKVAKAHERAAAKKADVDALRDAVQAVLDPQNYQTIVDVSARIDGEDVTVGKIQHRLSELVRLGIAEKAKVQVPVTDADGKSKTIEKMAYKLA